MNTIERTLAMATLTLTCLFAAACGGDSTEGRPEGLRGVCRPCVGDVPVGPNESTEACEAFAAEYGCENASLTGDCSNDVLADKATCEVTACELQPVCPTAD